MRVVQNDNIILYKIRKNTNIRNRYNQLPHLTQDTVCESDKNTTKRHIQESQEVSPFPTGDQKAARHKHDNKVTTNTNIKYPQNKYCLGTVSKKITGWLKLKSRYQPHP